MKRLFKQSQWRKKFNEITMTVFAVGMTVMPIFAIGLWTHQLFASDQRKVVSLQQLPESQDHRLFEEPLVSVSFDDGWQTVYTDAAPVLEKHGVRATFYVVPGTYGSSAYLSENQIKSLKKAGHDIGSHSMSHLELTSMTPENLQYEILESKKRLNDTGVITDKPSFASPFGATTPQTMYMIRENYYSQREAYNFSPAAIPLMNKGPKLDRYKIMAFSILNDTTDQELSQALEYAKKNNAWFVMVYHEIEDTDSKYAVDKVSLSRHLKLVKDAGIKTVTIDDVAMKASR